MAWTEEQQAELVRLAAEGLTGAEIGERMGFSRAAVLGRARRTGVRLEVSAQKEAVRRERISRARAGLPNPRMLDDQAVRSIRARLAEGASVASVARIFCVAPSTVSNIKHGRARPNTPADAESVREAEGV